MDFSRYWPCQENGISDCLGEIAGRRWQDLDATPKAQESPDLEVSDLKTLADLVNI